MALSEGDNASGGYLVRPQWMKQPRKAKPRAVAPYKLTDHRAKTKRKSR
jgi:hypothetical protein